MSTKDRPNDITIPPDALEAAARAIAAEMRVVTEIDVRAFELTPEEHAALARAACLAMLKAWPGLVYDESEAIILPLPTENTNGEG